MIGHGIEGKGTMVDINPNRVKLVSPIEVYYWKNSDFLIDKFVPTKRDFKKWYKKIPISFTPKQLKDSWLNPFDVIFQTLNLDSNPLGTKKNQDWIRANLQPDPHTSMSIGDVIKVGKNYYIVRDAGFARLWRS